VDTFRNTGIAINARMVGSPDVVLDKFQQLWKEGMKIIVVTYCQTPCQQQEVYDRIYRIYNG
jgi:G:T-mismatch repair DNA endonuclease (very short patch repair protein)